MVFFALLIPLLFLFVGMGIDLGWYYLNVSRLQNAADAAAVAGARELVERNNTFFKDYSIVLVDKKFAGYPESDEDIPTTESDKVAADYVRKNLSSDDTATALNDDSGNAYAYTVTDNWSPDSSEVTMTPHLGQNDDVFYYVVYLTEDIRHFLMPGRYEPMPAPVVAVALLTRTTPTIPRDPGKGSEQELPDGTDILTEMYKLEDKYVVRNWEWEKNATPAQYEAFMHKKKYNEPGGWTEYQEEKKKVYYTNGKKYRTEPIYVYDGSKSTSSAVHSSAENVASLNVDFNPDIEYELTDDSEDCDIGYTFPEGLKQTYRSSTGGYDLRIHANIDFEAPFAVRTNNTYNATDNPEDALYVRIESEPFNPLSFKPSHTYYSTVRQIFININQSNMDEQYRPLVIFYDGPEQMTANSTVRDSQPVVLTLKADARVILFAPNSPVVIRGNNHKMQGFVIAREFVQLTEASDYYQEDGKYYNSSAKTKEYFYVASEGTFIDEHGNVQTKSLGAGATRNRIEKDDREKPVGNTRIAAGYESYEKVYGMNNFNIAGSSFFDSFKIPSLKRTIYTYLDNYTDDEKDHSVDMFFTKIRASWID